MKIFIILLSFILFVPFSYSAPDVTNVTTETTISDGEEIIITGTSFGANGPTVSLFDDFELGTNGNLPLTGTDSAQVGEWDNYDDGPEYPEISNDTSISGSLAFHAECEGTDNRVNLSHVFPSPVTEAFGSWWLRIGPNLPTNWKTVWWMGNTSVQDDDIVTSTWTGSNWQLNGNDTDSNEYTDQNMTMGEWKRIWVRMTVTTTETGELQFWRLDDDGPVFLEDRDDFQISSGGDPPNAFERVWINANKNEGWSGDVYFDDVYIATGPYAQARIEIGTHSVYADCTNLAVVTPISWADTSITGVLRQGSFNTEDTAYVFVFDANGLTNSTDGYEVTIGGADVTAPVFNTATIDGTAVVINWSESCTRGVGYDKGDLDLDMSVTGNGIELTYVSGDGTSQWTMTADSAAVNGESVNLDFNGDANSIEDDADNDMESFSDETVTNNTSAPATTPSIIGVSMY